MRYSKGVVIYVMLGVLIMKKHCFVILMIFFAYGAVLSSDSFGSESNSAYDHFYEALFDGNIEFAEMLLDVNPKFKNQSDNQGATLLHSAVLHRFPEGSISFLIHNGWDLNAQDSDGKTALMYALEENDNSDILQLFFELPQFDITLQDHAGRNVVRYARRYYPYFVNSLQERLEQVQESNSAQKYFATLPDVTVATQRINNEDGKPLKKITSKNLTHQQMQSALPDSALPLIDWNLDKKPEYQLKWLRGKEDRDRILREMGALFQDGAGI